MNNNQSLATRMAERAKLIADMKQIDASGGYNRSIPVSLGVGDLTTCQFGNPGDTNWSAEEDGHVVVEILADQFLDVTQQQVFLVKKVGQEYVGRATISRAPRSEFEEAKLGALYCTNARKYGAIAQSWTGITTLEAAKHSLGF